MKRLTIASLLMAVVLALFSGCQTGKKFEVMTPLNPEEIGYMLTPAGDVILIKKDTSKK